MPVTLVERYNPDWPTWFERIRQALAPSLGEACLAIEHLGSTAIPGMTAKPIIDLIVVTPVGGFDAARACLEALGYIHQGDLGIAGREAFDLRDKALRDSMPPHHLYVCAQDSDELAKQRAFRDYVREHPEWAKRLSAKKRQLAVKYGNSRSKYITGKSDIVQEITALALKNRQKIILIDK